jgi:hypothetical protein
MGPDVPARLWSTWSQTALVANVSCTAKKKIDGLHRHFLREIVIWLRLPANSIPARGPCRAILTPLFIPELNASKPSNEGAAASNGVVGAGEIGDVPDTYGQSLQPADRRARCNTEAEAGYSKRIVAAAIRQDTAADTTAHEQTRLRDLEPDVSGGLRQRRRDRNDQHQQRNRRQANDE